MRRTLSTLALFSSLVACGYTDAGGGSKTLEVKASLSYTTSNNKLEAAIDVNKGGTPVDGATIVLVDGDTGDVFTVPQQNNGNNRRYVASIDNYHRKVQLKIDSGSDNLHAQIEGPGPHIVSKPANNAILNRASMGATFGVEWTTDDGIAADEVDVSLRGGYVIPLTDDSGSCSIPTSSLDNLSDRVKVERLNRVSLAGGVLASTLELGYSATNDVVVQN